MTQPCATEVATAPLMPAHLPPKSPSSTITGKFLLSTTSRSVIPRRRRRRSRSKDRIMQQQQRPLQQGKPPLAGGSSQDPSLKDPCPDHLNVAADSDDLSSSSDFSLVTFTNQNQSPSPTSVTESLLLDADNQTKRRHRKAKSWDSSDCYQDSSSKTCLPVPALFRRQKVMCADVASVSNASDTAVPIKGQRISGRELHETAKTVLNNGDLEQAVVMFEAIQKAQTDRFGEFHPSVGAAMHNVGVVRLRMGQHESAEDLLSRAVEIRRAVLTEDHLDLASSLSKLGSARLVLQKFDYALQDLKEAQRITRKTLGRNHKMEAQILCHVACLYFEAGELFSAQTTFEDALDIYREVITTEADREGCMAQMTETMCNIGSILNKRRSFTEAIACFKEALDLQRAAMGHDHARVIATLDNLGYSYSKNKKHHQALTCYKEMLTAQISRHGELTPECCVTLKKQILIYEKLGKLDKAVKVTQKILIRMSPIEPVVLKDVKKILDGLLIKTDKRGCF